MKYYALPYNKI